MKRIKLTEDEEKQIKQSMSECYNNVAYDLERSYKNSNVPISHAVCVVLDLLPPQRLMCRLDKALYEKFHQTSKNYQEKLVRSIL